MPNIALIAGNLVSDSGLDSSTINAQNYSRKHSARDFPNGTLIETTIDYSVTTGDPFVLEITGNSYGALVPFNMAYQGYIYNNTTINHGGISTGAAITGMSLFNYNGKLCFWFPSQAYWQGFNVYVYIANTGFRENKVTNITNVAKPAGITKEISMTFQHLIRAASASVGTTNYVAKFTGNVAVGDSQIFDNGTNVGIGTASPTAKLHIVQTTTEAGGNGLTIAGTGTGAQSWQWYPSSNQSLNLMRPGLRLAMFGNDGSFAIGGLSSDNGIGAKFWVNGTSGNVGIGTTTPGSKLSVSNGGAEGIEIRPAISSNLNQIFSYNRSSLDRVPLDIDTKTLAIQTEGTTKVFVSNAGNVGIGTTTPNQKLEVSGTTRISTTVGSTLGFLQFDHPGAQTWKFGVFSDNTSTLSIGNDLAGTFGSRYLNITNTGNVGIGTTSPQYKTHINETKNTTSLFLTTNGISTSNDFTQIGFGNVGNGSTVASYIRSIFIDPSNHLATSLSFATTNTANVLSEKMRIDATGNIGIGVIPSAWANLRPVQINSTAFVGHSTLDRGYVLSNAYFDGSSLRYINSNSALRYDIEGSSGTHMWFNAPSGTAGNVITWTQAMTLTSAGNLGIGTASPQQTLHVNTLTGGYLQLSRTAQGGTTSPFGGIYFGDGTTFQEAAILSYADGNLVSGDLQFYTRAAAGSLLERLRITSSGNVGIGTTSPAARLDVFTTSTNGIDLRNAPTTLGDQTSKNSPRLRLVSSRYEGGNVDAPFSLQNVRTGSPTNDQRLAITNFGDVEVMSITNLGNVGIGTTSPSSRLHISQSSTGNYASVILLSNSANTAADRTGIYGSAAPGTALPYRGGITFHPGASGAVSIHSGNNATPADGVRMYIQGNGRIGVNTTTDAGYQLDINGGTRVTGRLTITGNDTLAQSMSRAGTSAFASEIYNSGGDNSWLIWGVESSLGGVIFPGSTAYAAVIGQFRNTPLEFFTNNTIRGSFSAAGAFRVNNLAGDGSRIVVADANGVLSTTATAPITGTGTINYVPKFTAAGTIGNSQIFDNGTNVGINATSMAAPLSVFNSTANTAVVEIRGGGGSSQSRLSFTYGTTSATTAENGQIFGNTGEFSFRGGSNRALTFYTNPSTDTERLRIFANGRVGINTTTDAGYQLDVNGTGRFQGTLYTRSGTAVGIEMATTSAIRNSGTQYFDYGTGGSGDFYFRGGSGFANVLTLMNGGNVGIGTTSPAYKLDVNGNIAANSGSLYSIAPLYPQLILTETTGSSNSVIFYDGGASPKALRFRVAGSTDFMSITSAGELLVNTTSDAGDYKLQVAGNVLTNFIYTRNNTDALIFGTNSAVNPYVQGLSSNALVLGTSNNPRILITSDGNVGIGTTSPVSKLQVQGAQQNAAQTVIRFAANNASGQIKALDLQINAGSNLAVFNTAYAGSAMGIDFADAGTSRMRIDTVGNVGIGTDSPSHKLTLFRSGTAPSFISFRNGNTTSGDITIGASAGGDLYITNPNSTSISFFTSSSNPMNLTSGGSVLIGTVSDLGASYRLQVTGNTYQTGYAQINGVSNFPSVYVSSHIITGSSSQAVLSLGATLNTTGAPSIIYADISDTASGAETNFMQFVNGSTKFRVTKQGDIQTAAPAGGTAKKWKLGSVVTTTVTMVTSQYVEVEIDGTFYRLALVSPA